MTPPANELAGRVAIITGAGRGIGLGIARAFCEAGATCVIAELELAAGEAAAQQLREYGHNAWAQHSDVRSRESVDALVEAVLSESASGTDAELDEDLKAWARSVLGRAPGHDPAGGSPADGRMADDSAFVPGESVATDTGARPAISGVLHGEAIDEVIVFMSLSVPETSWRQWSAQAARIGAPIVLRGVVKEGFAATVRAIKARDPQDGAGIDPRLFRLFRIGSVPAVAVVPGGVPACVSPGCSQDPPPPHDLVTGNIRLDGALEAIAREGGPGRDAARRHLAVLRGQTE